MKTVPQNGEVMNDVSMNDKLKYPWQSPVLEALVELDPIQLLQKIAVAEAAIAERRSELNGVVNQVERIALDDAQQTLMTLKGVKD